MALKPCRECGAEVSSSAKTCPHCGVRRPVPTGGWGCLGAFLALMALVIWGGQRDLERRASVDCLQVGASVFAAIEDGLEVGGGGSLGRARAVKSSEHRNAFYLAAEIQGQGMGGAVGVWLVNSLTEPGVVLSVDHMADEFSVWPKANPDVAGSADSGARDARGCLR